MRPSPSPKAFTKKASEGIWTRKRKKSKLSKGKGKVYTKLDSGWYEIEFEGEIYTYQACLGYPHLRDGEEVVAIFDKDTKICEVLE